MACFLGGAIGKRGHVWVTVGQLCFSYSKHLDGRGLSFGFHSLHLSPLRLSLSILPASPGRNPPGLPVPLLPSESSLNWCLRSWSQSWGISAPLHVFSLKTGVLPRCLSLRPPHCQPSTLKALFMPSVASQRQVSSKPPPDFPTCLPPHPPPSLPCTGPWVIPDRTPCKTPEAPEPGWCSEPCLGLCLLAHRHHAPLTCLTPLTPSFF